MVGQAGLGDLQRYLDPLLLAGSEIDPSGARMKKLSVQEPPVSPCQIRMPTGLGFWNSFLLCMSTFYMLWRQALVLSSFSLVMVLPYGSFPTSLTLPLASE